MENGLKEGKSNTLDGRSPGKTWLWLDEILGLEAKKSELMILDVLDVESDLIKCGSRRELENRG